MSIAHRHQIPQYFSRARVGAVIMPPTIIPAPEIVTQFKDRDGEQVNVKAMTGGGKPKKNESEEEEPKKKKKLLPGEKLLRKLTNTKSKDDKVKRIVRSIRKTIVDDDADFIVN